MSDDFSLEMQAERGGSPIGVLSVFSLHPKRFKKNFFYVGSQEPVHCLKIEFEYDGVRVPADHSEMIVEVGPDRVICNRAEEAAFLAHFEVSNYPRITTTYHWISGNDPHRSLRTCRSDAEWLTFTQKEVPALRAAGWRVEIDPAFTLSIHAPEQWYVDLEEKADGQFDAQIGFELSNQRINILPFLLKRLRGENTDGLLTLEDGRKVLVPAERIELLTASLLELLDKDAVSKNAESIEIPWVRAMELAQFQALEDFTSELPSVLKKNADRRAPAHHRRTQPHPPALHPARERSPALAPPTQPHPSRPTPSPDRRAEKEMWGRPLSRNGANTALLPSNSERRDNFYTHS